MAIDVSGQRIGPNFMDKTFEDGTKLFVGYRLFGIGPEILVINYQLMKSKIPAEPWSKLHRGGT